MLTGVVKNRLGTTSRIIPTSRNFVNLVLNEEINHRDYGYKESDGTGYCGNAMKRNLWLTPPQHVF